MPNEFINDPEFSWKAKMLYLYLSSKPDGWNFAVDRISNDALDGRKGTASGIRELEDAGLLMRHRAKDGRMVYELIDYYDEPLPQKGNVQNGSLTKRHFDKKGKISNKEVLSNKEIVRKKVKKKVQTSYTFDMFWNCYGYKKGKHTAQQKWSKLPENERKLAMKYLPQYKQDTIIDDSHRVNGSKFKPFRKNPTTYINQRVWEDYMDGLTESGPSEADRAYAKQRMRELS
jgi:hypothetical protein